MPLGRRRGRDIEMRRRTGRGLNYIRPSAWPSMGTNQAKSDLTTSSRRAGIMQAVNFEARFRVSSPDHAEAITFPPLRLLPLLREPRPRMLRH